MFRVYLVWGSEAIALVYDVMKRDATSLHAILGATEIYEFETDAEAEAFRIGLCEVSRYTESVRDFAEIPPAMFHSLRKMSRLSA
jgi:hypothetical protein